MAETAAVNASPLIFLAWADMLDFLRLAARCIVIPRAVAEEVLRRGPQDMTAKAIADKDWLTVQDTPPVPPRIHAWDLGPGESSVLAWGWAHLGHPIIVDDLAARRCAMALGIPLHGTLGLILSAKQCGRIAKARPVLETLRESGMYLSQDVLDRALARVGE